MKSLRIISLGISGEGIGSLDGLKVFVDDALPSEEVEVLIQVQKKNYAIGKLEKIITPSPSRVKPVCPLFSKCGGCQIMHLDYPSQLIAKKKRVIDAFERIGGFKNPPVESCVPSPDSLHYRNKIQLPVMWTKEGKVIGLFRKQSHEIIPVETCLIQSDLGEKIFSMIKQQLTVDSVRYVLIRTAETTREVMVIFVTNGKKQTDLDKFGQALMHQDPNIKSVVENINRRTDNVIMGSEFRLIAGRFFILDKILGKTFKVSPASFFQVNPRQAEKLYARAIELADIDSSHSVLDAFCGVGTLALFAADHAKKVVGIESVPQAVFDAKENAKLNGAKNCEFIKGNAELVIERVQCVDRIFLNPPRKGCEPKLLQAVSSRNPEKIIYISCDPATLARDLATFKNYRLEKVEPFDMFPQTMHVETLVALTRK